jgi:hypothetical protein
MVGKGYGELTKYILVNQCVCFPSRKCDIGFNHDEVHIAVYLARMRSMQTSEQQYFRNIMARIILIS